MKQPSCEERISKEWADTREMLIGVGAIFNGETPDQEFMDHWEPDLEDGVMWFYNSCLLAIETATPDQVADGDFLTRGCNPPDAYDIAVHLQMSWGGPADGIIMYADLNRRGPDLTTAYYYFQDWYDGATRKIYDRESLKTLDRILSDLYDLGQFGGA